MNIRLLDNWTITKIKAGQVISNYKDIVKELIENSIDADSTNIAIYLNFHRQEIRVVDNGKGMTKEDLILCTTAHATSKFTSLDDICYLGFRGEGLYVISECSDITISSKTSQGIGYKLSRKLSGEFTTSVEAFNDGTEVVVRNIFARTPSKLKFLTPNKDFINSIIYIQMLCLSHRHIKFHIYKNDKSYLYLHGENYEDLIYQIFKIENCNHLYLEEEDFSINMYFNTNLKDEKGQILFFVNKRPVEDFGLLQTIKGLVFQHTGESNIKFLLMFINIKKNFVDCNITPSKSQVRISILNDIKVALKRHFVIRPSNNNHYQLKEEAQFLESHNLRCWFTYKNKYIIAYYNDDIYMIDHHAISERLILQQIENSSYNTQLLLNKISINLTEEELYLMHEKSEDLRSLKFNYQLIGSYLLIDEIPDFLESHEVAGVVKKFLHEDNNHMFLHFLSDISCRNALKAGYKVNEAEVKEFIINTSGKGYCQHCNHGRNTYILFDEKGLNKMFGRK